MTPTTEIKQPNFFLMIRVWLAIALPLVTLYFSGMKGVVDFALVWGFFSFLLLASAYKKFRVKKWNASTKDYFNEKGDGIWSHEYFSSQIIIDTQKGKIFLKEEDKQKTYNLSDVKECHYNLFHGGDTSVGGLAEMMENTVRTNKNLYQSGFFVTVNDVLYPEWHIRFFPRKGHINSQEGVRDMELQLKRWMQVFDQVLNQAGK